MTTLRALPLLAMTLLVTGAVPGAVAASETVDLVATDEPRRAFYRDGEANPTLTFRSGDEVTVNVRFGEGTHNFRVLRPIDAVTPTRDAGAEALTFTIPADFTGTIAYLCDYHDDKMRGTIRVEAGDGGTGGSGGSEGHEGSDGSDGNVTEEETIEGDGSGGNRTDASEGDESGGTDATDLDDGAVADDGDAGSDGAADGGATAGGTDTPATGALAVVAVGVGAALGGRGWLRRRER